MARAGRTSIKGTKAKKDQFKHKQHSYGLRHAVLQAYDKETSIAALNSKYFPGETSADVRGHVCKWKKKRLFIAIMASSSVTSSQTRHRERGLGTALPTSVETEIVRWINGLRQDGVPVSAKMLELHAIECAEAHGIPKGKFTASNSWKASFLQRHRLSFRAKNRSSQAYPDVDNVLGATFGAQVRGWMAEYGVSRVFNAAQTAVFFEMIPKKTVAQRGARTVWVKCGKKEKQRATAMLLADSEGNKYDPFLVFKTQDSTITKVHKENVEKRHGFGKLLWKEIKDIQDAYGAQIYGNATAWWNSDLTIAWLKHFFGDRTVASSPVLLFLDPFSGHWTDDVAAYAATVNVILKPVPPKLTWRCQPADVAWIKPLKDGLRRQWVDFLRDQLNRRRNSTARFVMKPPSRGDVAEWLTDGWLRLSERTIISGFSKCGFRDRLPGRDDETTTTPTLDASDVVEAMELLGALDDDVGEVQESADLIRIVEEVLI